MLLSKFMYFIHLHHICGINRETGVSQGSRSQSRQDTPSVTAAMSSSSFFLTICFFFHMLDRISTKLGQNDQWVSGYKSYALFDLKGHVRVTGVKKVIFTENASPPTCFIGF